MSAEVVLADKDMYRLGFEAVNFLNYSESTSETYFDCLVTLRNKYIICGNGE